MDQQNKFPFININLFTTVCFLSPNIGSLFEVLIKRYLRLSLFIFYEKDLSYSLSCNFCFYVFY